MSSTSPLFNSATRGPAGAQEEEVKAVSYAPFADRPPVISYYGETRIVLVSV